MKITQSNSFDETILMSALMCYNGIKKNILKEVNFNFQPRIKEFDLTYSEAHRLKFLNRIDEIIKSTNLIKKYFKDEN